jgi:hypothetical protein
MRRHLMMLGIALVVLSGGVSSSRAADPDPLATTVDEAFARGHRRVVVRVHFGHRSELAAIAPWLDPWTIDLERRSFIADVGRDGYRRLLDLGFDVELMPKRTATLDRPRRPLPGQENGIPGFPCYRTVEETLATGQALADANPNLAQWIDIGDSWEKVTPGGLPGYDLMVLRLTNQGMPGDKPVLWIEGAIHARELTTAELVTRFAEHLLAGYGLDPDITWILDHHEVHILLQTNPDGRKHAETGLSWRKNTNESYCSPTSQDRGADLNRNFDFEWGCCGGSSSYGCDQTFRGASPASEPETQAVQSYVASVIPDWRPDDTSTPAPDDAHGMFLDIHSAGGWVLSSWGFQDFPPPPNANQIMTLGRKFAYFNGYEALLGSIYTVDGSTKDWAYGRLGVPGYTFELGTEFFEQCATFESTVLPDNLNALLYAAKAVRRPYTAPAGPDVLNPVVTPTVVEPGQPFEVTAVADDSRYEAGSGEPVQNIAAAEVFVDQPPWIDGATPVAMTAGDGAFNQPVEAVVADLGSGGLGDGRHAVFVRSRDDSGAWGAPSSAFFWVLDPDSAGHLVGEVRSLDGGTPLDAMLSVGPFTGDTDPADGSYRLALPPGAYDVSVSAPEHGTLTVEDVQIVQGFETPLDVLLAPYDVILEDDVESGDQGWTADPTWAVTGEASASPTHSWTDSPGGEYANNRDISLTSRVLDLTGVTGVEMAFSHIYDIESGWDYGHVEVSADQGANWETVASFTGIATGAWERETIGLPQLNGAGQARIRFRLETDGSVTEDGWHVDDIVLRGAGDGQWFGTIFHDGFESGDTSLWSFSVP